MGSGRRKVAGLEARLIGPRAALARSGTPQFAPVMRFNKFDAGEGAPRGVGEFIRITGGNRSK